MRVPHGPRLRGAAAHVFQQLARAKKKEPQTAELEFDPKQRWRLERDLDGDTRRVCEAT